LALPFFAKTPEKIAKKLENKQSLSYFCTTTKFISEVTKDPILLNFEKLFTLIL